ncbi:MAG: biotin/lipoate A/B protein ligase family protein [Pseudomonadota bacterium]|jgi:lipoate-protein ligase A
MQTWRVIDTGIRRAAENFALNRALLEARKNGASPSTLRFLQFKPSALLGYHQSAEQELKLDYCAEHGIDIQRRITGGGALYMDETQFGWELYLHKSDLGSADMTAIARRICEAAARGISSFGVDARFRPRNDIEVGGRKISGTGGAFDGDALLYQGTLLVEFDVEKMLRCLRIPAEKLSDKAIQDARDRVVNLKDLLGYAPPLDEVKGRVQQAFAAEFGVKFEPGGLNETEQKLFREALAQIDTPEWIHLVRKPQSDLPILEAGQKFAGGLLRAAVAYDRVGSRIKQTWFTGDIFVNPRRTVADLEAALKDLALDKLDETVRGFFAGRQVDMLTLTPDDFIAVVKQAVDSGR